MSCVVGLINNGSVYIGGDGRATTNDGEIRPIVASKVFKNKKYLFGYSGSVRSGQVLLPEYFEPPDNIVDMADAVREQLKRKGCMGSNEDQIEATQSNFLIGYEGRLYEILIDFQLNEIYGEYTAIGSGSSFALGAFFATKRVKNPIKRIKIALDASKEFCSFVGDPYTILSI